MSGDSRGWFAVPSPVRRLFNHFPLHVYSAEELPHRAPLMTRQKPSLYVFAVDEDAARGRPSFNPSCLKWQTLLRIARIDVDIVPSNNHASPSGALPFLLTPSSSTSKASVPLTGNKIYEYAKQNGSLTNTPETLIPRSEAYQSLITQSLRAAWLYALYLAPSNANLLADLYLPSSPLLRHPLRHTLRNAATAEILKTTRGAVISPPQLYADATEALAALSTLLGDDDWFFASDDPALFDAEVFSYTYLILDESLAWQDTRLAECLSQFENLVRHRERLYQKYWTTL